MAECGHECPPRSYGAVVDALLAYDEEGLQQALESDPAQAGAAVDGYPQRFDEF